MLAVTAIAGLLLLFPKDLVTLAESLRYALVGLSNFYFLREAEGYFNLSVQQMPLLHTWSLAVEEQFYLFFPLLLLLLNRVQKLKQRVWLILVLLFALSLGCSIHAVSVNPLAAFFTLPSRAWEMILGGVISLLVPALPKFHSSVYSIACLLGLFFIGASMWSFDSQTAFPGLAALTPCMGTAIILMSGSVGKGGITKILSCKLLGFIGKISYSMYLWLWPLLAFIHIRYPDHGDWGWAVFAVTLLLGWVSWRFVESPFRKHSKFTAKRTYAMWLVMIMCFMAGALYIRSQAGFPQRFSKEVLKYLRYEDEPRLYGNRAGKRGDLFNAPIRGDTSVRPTYAVWGDSHSEALMPLLDAMAKSAGVSLRQYGMSGQPPIPGLVAGNVAGAANKAKYGQDVMNELLRNTEIHTVILHARWTYYLKGEGGTAPAFSGHSFTSQKDLELYYIEHLKQTIQKLYTCGKRVVIVYPVPEPGISIPRYLAMKAMSGASAAGDLYLPDYNNHNAAVLRVFDSIIENEKLIKIRPVDRLLKQDHLVLTIKDEPTYFDDDHLSKAGSFALEDLFSSVFTH